MKKNIMFMIVTAKQYNIVGTWEITGRSGKVWKHTLEIQKQDGSMFKGELTDHRQGGAKSFIYGSINNEGEIFFHRFGSAINVCYQSYKGNISANGKSMSGNSGPQDRLGDDLWEAKRIYQLHGKPQIAP
jgi:hypothetical protein